MTEKRKTTWYAPVSGKWLNWLGHPVRYLAEGDDTAGRYCASIGIAEEGQGAPPHRHDFEEGFYLLKGKVEFRAGDQSVTLEKGEFIHIGSMTAHQPIVLSEMAELLTIAAPSGFDQFQFQAGEPLESPESSPSKTESEIRDAIFEIAADYGIEMNPGDEAFDVAPDVHICRTGEGNIIDVVGDRYRFLVEGEHSGGTFSLWHATVSAGGGPPLHTHSREEEAFYVLKGELTFESDGEEFSGGPGTFVNLPVGTKHRFSNPTDSEAEMLILVAPAGLEKMFRQTGTSVTDPSVAITPVSLEEKQRLLRIAPDFGVEIHLPG